MTKVLVTGGAGYIGSHTALALLESGFVPIVLDNLSQGHRSPLDALGVEVIEGDICDLPLLDRLFRANAFEAVMHFAAYAYVGESVEAPAKYYRNNVGGTLNLLEAMIAANVLRIVFSSSCATYGIPNRLPIAESTPQHPVNPYGRSKLMVEQILRDFDCAYGLRSIAFRYFNAAGADPVGRLGESHEPETHLIPRALLAALRHEGSVPIFGLDHDTADGTGIRDYVHVCDLASAHVAGLTRLIAGCESDVFNLGNGQGFSVLEVLESVRRVTGREVPTMQQPRRAGDPPALFADAQKARTVLGWHPRYAELDTIIGHAWQWQWRRRGVRRSISPQLPSNAAD